MITELSCRRLILVKDQDGEEALSIHRSLQQKILEDIDKDAQKREEVFAQAFSLVRKRFPLPSPIQVPEPAKWPVCKENLPHVLRIQTVVTDLLPSILPSVEVARLLSDGGINLWERGMTNEGLRLLRSAEAILDQLKSDENQLRANIHIIIALLIQDYGFSYIAESKDRIEKALQIRKDHLSYTRPYLYTRDHDILLHNAWSDYGCVLLQYNKHIEAEPIFRRCLVKYHEWGNETEIPYEYYKFNHHTAFCRLYYGDFAEAIKLAEEGLRMVTLATGQSSATSKTRFDLACIVLQSGDTTRALELHQQVLESNLKQHGKFSFLTLQSYYAVGALHAYRGELADAEYVLPPPPPIPFCHFLGRELFQSNHFSPCPLQTNDEQSPRPRTHAERFVARSRRRTHRIPPLANPHAARQGSGRSAAASIAGARRSRQYPPAKPARRWQRRRGRRIGSLRSCAARLRRSIYEQNIVEIYVQACILRIFLFFFRSLGLDSSRVLERRISRLPMRRLPQFVREQLLSLSSRPGSVFVYSIPENGAFAEDFE